MTADVDVPAATPDDGTRRSPTTVWDEAARPTGPTVAVGRTYSVQGQAVAAHLIEIHDHLRGELQRVLDLVEQVQEGYVSAAQARQAINDLTLRQHDWTLGAYCASFCRFVSGHHGLEDAAVFPHLRASDGQLEPVLDRLAAEHVVIHGLLEAVDAGLVHLVQNPGDLGELQLAVDQLSDALLSHLSYEEQQLLEPLARLGFYPGQV